MRGQGGDLVTVGRHTNAAHIDGADGVPAQALSRMGVEEGRVGVAFTDRALLPALAPVRRPSFQSLREAVLADGANL